MEKEAEVAEKEEEVPGEQKEEEKSNLMVPVRILMFIFAPSAVLIFCSFIFVVLALIFQEKGDEDRKKVGWIGAIYLGWYSIFASGGWLALSDTTPMHLFIEEDFLFFHRFFAQLCGPLGVLLSIACLLGDMGFVGLLIGWVIVATMDTIFTIAASTDRNYEETVRQKKEDERMQERLSSVLTKRARNSPED